MEKDPIDMDAFEQAFDRVFADKWGNIVRPKITAVSAMNDELADIGVAILLRESQRLQRSIAAYRDLIEQHVYPMERAEPHRFERHHENIEELFELLTDQVEALQKFALMLMPTKERG